MSDEEQADKFEGWMRAIEAPLLQLPDVTLQRVELARQYLENRPKSDFEEMSYKLRKKLNADEPFDKHGDSALKHMLETLNRMKST